MWLAQLMGGIYIYITIQIKTCIAWPYLSQVLKSIKLELIAVPPPKLQHEKPMNAAVVVSIGEVNI